MSIFTKIFGSKKKIVQSEVQIKALRDAEAALLNIELPPGALIVSSGEGSLNIQET